MQLALSLALQKITEQIYCFINLNINKKERIFQCFYQQVKWIIDCFFLSCLFLRDNQKYSEISSPNFHSFFLNCLYHAERLNVRLNFF